MTESDMHASLFAVRRRPIPTVRHMLSLIGAALLVTLVLVLLFRTPAAASFWNISCGGGL